MMDLKEVVFFRAQAEMEAMKDLERLQASDKDEFRTTYDRFYSVYQVIEEAELVQEFKQYLKEN